VTAETCQGQWQCVCAVVAITITARICLAPPTVLDLTFLNLFTHFLYFLARDSIYAIARYMPSPGRPSVWPSVCLAVCLSHRWITGSVKDA